eukprot:NODE_105_length_19900_cov_0.306550.p6 type:complete len:278 gc:universal NODE_105_length_19900_cov_0.306550:15515-16348(+)
MSFYQQSIPGLRIVLKVNDILIIFVAIAILFISGGLTILRWSLAIPEIQINYTNCRGTPLDINYMYYGSSDIQDLNLGWSTTVVDGQEQCIIDFYVPEDIQNPLVYYQLDNFYQSNRVFVKSFSYKQLVGNAITDKDKLNLECGNSGMSGDKIVYPCGSVPNTMFNDTLVEIDMITGIGLNPSRNLNLFTYKDIGWTSRTVLYKNTSYDASKVVPPSNWIIKYDDSNINVITTSPKFRVWTHLAAFPVFRKLWSRMNDTLVQGYYRLTIQDSISRLM